MIVLPFTQINKWKFIEFRKNSEKIQWQIVHRIKYIAIICNEGFNVAMKLLLCILYACEACARVNVIIVKRKFKS